MGKPSEHIPVKLVTGLISNQDALFEKSKKILEKKFGKVDSETGIMDFSCTKYYEDEMGSSLKRKFLSFKRLINLKNNYRIKLFTNAIEKKLSKDNRRLINIDPGYIAPSKLVLFTTKNRSHRIYIEKGIYAEAELQFVNKTFVPLKETYPDYRAEEYIDFFNQVREVYLSQAKSYL